MANDKGKPDITYTHMHVIAVMWISIALLLLVLLVATFWDRICASIAINALELGMKELATPR